MTHLKSDGFEKALLFSCHLCEFADTSKQSFAEILANALDYGSVLSSSDPKDIEHQGFQEHIHQMLSVQFKDFVSKLDQIQLRHEYIRKSAHQLCFKDWDNVQCKHVKI